MDISMDDDGDDDDDVYIEMLYGRGDKNHPGKMIFPPCYELRYTYI